MNAKKTLATFIFALSLIAGMFGASSVAPSAHAAAGSQLCRSIICIVVPSLTVTGGDGELYLQGANWAANRWIELDIYAPVGSGLPLETTQAVFTSKTGTFLTAYVAPGACFYGKMEVQAIDSVSNTVVTSYGIPGCIG